MAAYPSVTTSDQLPATAINAAAGEIYFAAAKGKNPQGGKEYLRTMLSKEAALGFTKLTKSLTVVAGAADGQTISPGLTSANDLLSKAGKDVFMGYLFDTWYKKLDDESRGAANDLMFKGGDAQKFCDRMEAASQAGIELRPFFHQLSRMPPYASYARQCPNSERLSQAGINLPTSSAVDEQSIKRIGRVFREVLA